MGCDLITVHRSTFTERKCHIPKGCVTWQRKV